MRNAKQLFSVLLIVALASGTLLAGCTGNSSKDNKAEIKGEAKKEEITVSIYDRGQVPADEGKLEDNRWTRWINENAPAHVKFVPIPRLEAKQKLNVLFASGSAPDLIFEFSRTVKDPLYEQKQLMPLDDLIQKHSTNYKKLIEQFPSLAKAGKKSDGKIYEFGKLNEVRPQNGILIRNDWLKKLNLEVPKTTEDLYKVAKAFAERDPDGNGKKDTYGLALSSNANDIVNMMFQHVNWVIKNGQMTHDWDNAKEAVAFKERLYDEGIIDKDFLNDKNGAKAKQHFITGKLGIYPLQFGWNQFGVQILQPLKKNVPEAEIIPIALPASPAGAFNPLWSNPVQTTAVIKANAKNPEAVMKYVDFLIEPSTITTLREGIEGVHYKLDGAGCPQPIDHEKNSKELAYISSDLSMLANSPFVTERKCGFDSGYNLSNPADKEMYDMAKLAEKTYMDFSRTYSQFTFPEHMPQLPDEIGVTAGEMFKQIEDLWVKAILSGTGYSADQAVTDSKELWNKGNGKAADDWMRDWYEKNKNTAFLTKDLYEIAKQQMQMKQNTK